MKLLVHGAGGHAKVVVDAALACGFEIAGIVGRAGDPESLLGIDVGHDASAVTADGFIVAVGDNEARARIYAEYLARGLEPATIVHPSATIAPRVRMGRGTFVAAGVVVNTCAHIGDDAILNTGCTVDHDCIVGDHALVGPAVSMCGASQVGAGVLMGVGSCLIPSRTVGDWSVVGAGAAVVADLPPRSVCVGVPARVIGTVDA